MNNYLKRYKIQLTTIGPIFIGSGELIKKREWLLNRNKNQATIIDFPKLFEFLTEKKLLDSFEQYLVSENKPLFVWMNENKICENDYSRFTRYTLDTKGVNFTKDIRDIQTFIKDAYEEPYIPGSSLKGTIRNIILAKRISDCNLNIDEIKKQINEYRGNKKKFLNREAKDLQVRMFNTKCKNEKKKADMVNDIMSGIRISDSEPLNRDCLTLCQKIDYKVKGEENKLPILRECIKPGTKISMDMSIDTMDTDIDADYIMDAVDDFVAMYNQFFLENFADEELYDGNVVYIGGGVGFASKTVLNQVLGRLEDFNRVKLISSTIDKTLGKPMHAKDFTLGVSPRVVKLTEYDGNLIQMGPCRIDIIPV